MNEINIESFVRELISINNRTPYFWNLVYLSINDLEQYKRNQGPLNQSDMETKKKSKYYHEILQKQDETLLYLYQHRNTPDVQKELQLADAKEKLRRADVERALKWVKCLYVCLAPTIVKNPSKSYIIANNPSSENPYEVTNPIAMDEDVRWDFINENIKYISDPKLQYDIISLYINKYKESYDKVAQERQQYKAMVHDRLLKFSESKNRLIKRLRVLQTQFDNMTTVTFDAVCDSIEIRIAELQWEMQVLKAQYNNIQLPKLTNFPDDIKYRYERACHLRAKMEYANLPENTENTISDLTVCAKIEQNAIIRLEYVKRICSILIHQFESLTPETNKAKKEKTKRNILNRMMQCAKLAGYKNRELQKSILNWVQQHR